MQFNKKLIQFFKSWRYLDFNAKNSTILMGYQGEDLLKYFDLDAENYICPSTKRPFNFKIILKSLLIFFKTLIFRPLLFLKTLRWIHTIYFVCAFIEKKKVTNIVSFADYNLVP